MELTFDQLPQAVNQIFDKLVTIERLLIEKETPPEAEKILTIEQAASFLNLAKVTLYGKVSRRELPVSKRGKRLYFLRSELESYIKAGHKKTSDELRGEASAMMQKQRRVMP